MNMVPKELAGGLEGTPEAHPAQEDLLDPAESPLSATGSTNLFMRTINWFEKWLLVLVLGGFVAGIVVVVE